MNLRAYLDKHRLSISAFARRASLTPSTVHRAAAGTVTPSPETLRAIAKASGGEVQPNDFYSSVYDQRAASGAEAVGSNGRSGLRIGIDIGGTFTDLIVVDEAEGRSFVEKVPTTPGNLAAGVLGGLDHLALAPGAVEMIVHGTTIGLNAFIERRGAPTGLITTAGFRDIYEIGRHNRVETYDLFYRKPQPLVPRRYRLEVTERVGADGKVQVPLDETDVLNCIATLREAGIRSIAVCLLHSYLNPAHEERIREIFELEYPEASVTISSALLRQWREYERTSTTAVNAYIMPVVGKYLDDLQAALAQREYQHPLFVSQSAGGVMSVASARNKPVQTIMSGPSGGVLAASFVSASLSRPNIITFDMGGTSTDVALVHEGKIKVAGEAILDRHPLLVSMIDIQSIGAGGGSIARVNPTGALEVGPESAGASPGPVCYGRGGNDPTVTDANLVLGRLPANHFLGGAMTLDVAKACQELKRRIAEPLNLSLNEAAAGVIEVINVKMAYAVRAITVERGLDPKDFALMPFGGAGPMHACAIARHLGIPEIIIPRTPGAFSAFGMLVSDIRHDFVRTCLASLNDTDSVLQLDGIFSEMIVEARHTLVKESVSPDRMRFDRAIDVRYVGQEYTVVVPLTAETFDATAVIALQQRFHRMHELQYGHASLSEPLEIVNLRLVARGLIPRPARSLCDKGTATPAAEATLDYSDAIFPRAGGALRTPLVDRQRLLAGNVLEGPVILVEHTATTVVEPGFRAEVLPGGEVSLVQES